MRQSLRFETMNPENNNVVHRSRIQTLFQVLLLVILSATCSSAQTLTGTVIDRTTGKPAAGDEVVLLSLRQGMEESGHGKTDGAGHFSIGLDDGSIPHLVRAIHQGVTYHRMAPPGTTSADVEVYDVAKKVKEVSVTADVMRLQSKGGTLQGVRRFAISNNSTPPRSQIGETGFEFYLPEGAKVESGMAQSGANGQPVNSEPVPQNERNRYAFRFPLRPGETQFQVSFQVPYTGEADIDPKILYPAQHFVVMLPKSMHFTAGSNSNFQSMQDPSLSDVLVEVASETRAAQSLAFRVSGTGNLPVGVMQTAAAGGNTAGQGRDSVPGGGLAPPGNAPDPLGEYRWYILVGLALLLGSVAIYITLRRRTVSEHSPSNVLSAQQSPAARTVAALQPAVSSPSPLLMEALKEEFFLLEVEHKQGNISPQEYKDAKAALDRTLERAIKRAPTS